MTRHFTLILAAAVALAGAVRCPSLAAEIDIKAGAPLEAHLVVYGMHNSEREAEAKYAAEAWRTWQEERIGERFIEIVSSKMPADKLDEAQSVIDEVKIALAPINVEALKDAQEVVYAQVLDGPFNQHLFLMRLPGDDAKGFEEGIGNLFKLLSEKSGGKAPLQTTQAGAATIQTFGLPPQAPLQPSVARLDDVLILSTSAKLTTQAAERLQGAEGTSKFDDPRLIASLKKLPEAEDAVTFFDGKQLDASLAGISQFIRGEIAKQQANNPEKAAEGERMAGLMDRIFEECMVIDYITTVEYTDEGDHRTKGMGEWAEGYESRILGKMLSQGVPFENWDSWVPADATAYSLNTGANLHALYEGIMTIVQEKFPESKEPLAKFEAKQDEIGVHIDEDILQAFPGECVSVTFPVEKADGGTKQESVTAMRCTKPEKIRELLNRGFAGLSKIPALQAQQLALADCEGLEGFQEVRGAFLQMVGATPVIGFRDGWMMMSSSKAAVEKVLAVREGQGDSINHAESFEKMKLDPKGPVTSVAYGDVGQGIRDAADMIEKVGAMAPMFIGMAAGGQAKPEDLKPVMDMIGLLPSVAKVVRKFDYMEHYLSVARPGDAPGTFVMESVLEIRKPSNN